MKAKYYNKIFSRDYNIGFEPVKKDICKLCTKLNVLIENGKKASMNIQRYEEELREHRQRYLAAREAMAAAKNNQDEDHVALAIDLQQTMHCPKLSVAQAYYKTKMWIYYLCP